jgi:hypothetical protein
MSVSAAIDSSPNMVDFTVLDWRVNLALVHPRELGYECTNPVRVLARHSYIAIKISIFAVLGLLDVPLHDQGTPKFTV